MNVLSLFDGISVSHQALKDLKIPVENYYSSEIDKYALSVSMNHHKQTRLGDIKGCTSWDWGLGIDLLIGGSPCQGFSFAGKQWYKMIGNAWTLEVIKHIFKGLML